MPLVDRADGLNPKTTRAAGRDLFHAPAVVIGTAILSVFVLILPILWFEVLPQTDMLHHVARHAIRHAAISGDALAGYFEVGPPVPGNMTVDWIASTGLMSDPLLMMRILNGFYVATFAVALLALHKAATGRLSVAPLVGMGLVYAAPFYWGFQNFYLTVPLLLLVLAGWVATPQMPLLRKILLFAVPVTLVFACHRLAFVALALAVFGAELDRIVTLGNRLKTFGRAATLSLAFVPALIVAAAVPISRQGALEMGVELPSLQSMAQALNSMIGTAWINDAVAPPVLISVLVALVQIFLGAFLLAAIYSGVRIARPLRGPVLSLLLASLLMPPMIMSVGLLQIRFPFIASALLLASLDFSTVGRRMRGATIALIAFLVVAETADLATASRPMARDIAGLRGLLEDLPPDTAVDFEVPIAEARYRWHMRSYVTLIVGDPRTSIWDGVQGVAKAFSEDDLPSVCQAGAQFAPWIRYVIVETGSPIHRRLLDRTPTETLRNGPFTRMKFC